MNYSRQRGIGLLAVIALILAAIGLLLLGGIFWAAAENARASTCQTNLGTLQRHYDQWRLACLEGNTNEQSVQLTSMNGIITQWNAGECKKYGTLPAQPATCPPQ